MTANEAWKQLGNCRGMNPDLFFPNTGIPTTAAKKVCAGCVVRDDCLEYALVNALKFGVFGGKSERERRKLRRDRNAARAMTVTDMEPGDPRHGTVSGYNQRCRCEPCRAAKAAYIVRHRTPEPILPRGRTPKSEHGTRAEYARGCHCDECSTANSDYFKARRNPQIAQLHPQTIPQVVLDTMAVEGETA